MNQIIRFINDSDETAALAEFNRQWEQFPWPSRYFTLLFPTAVTCLELNFPGPHGLKYHYTLYKICENLPGMTVKFLLERYLGYLIRRPKFYLFEPPKTISHATRTLNPREALHDSLKNYSYHNALFYLYCIREKESYSAAADELLKICILKIDELGHNFTCPLGIINAGLISERTNEPAALHSLLDYAFRMVDNLDRPLLKNPRPFPEILGLAVDAPGLLGHNLILADAIERYGRQLGDQFRDHLLKQLDYNVKNSPRKYIDTIQENLSSTAYFRYSSLTTLVEHLRGGNLQDACKCISQRLNSGEELFEAMIVIMACVDNYQPHYYTYPLAVRHLSDNHPVTALRLFCGWADFIIEEANIHGWVAETGSLLRNLIST